MVWYLEAKEKEYNIKHTWVYGSEIKALRDYWYLENSSNWRNIQYPTQEKAEE